jgi:pantoate--beta-alanine ligase
MGALHRGHAALIQRARELAGATGSVVVSIFVNPTQFGPKEDFARYPRGLSADLRVCSEAGADFVFNPTADAMYLDGFSTFVQEEIVSQPLCGARRPGHFRGVCTVVAKLFHIIEPDASVFGLKDFQQYVVIRRMVRDLNLQVRIEAVETVREADGLALSSRNRCLTQAQRAEAPVLRCALLTAAEAFRRGETRAAKLRAIMMKMVLTAPHARLDYLEVVDSETLQPVSHVRAGAVFAIAVFFGKTRLIDNLWLKSRAY